MAELITEQVFNGSPEKVYAALRKFPEYPNYMPGVTAATVLPAKLPNSTCQVRLEMKFIKTFAYTLDMFETAPSKLWWTLAESNLMKQSSGSWDLSDAGGGKTRAVYTLDVVFSGLVPQKVVDQVTKANLPALMIGVQKMVDAMPKKA